MPPPHGRLLLVGHSPQLGTLRAVYLHRGVWEGRHILPVEWVDYSRAQRRPPPRHGTACISGSRYYPPCRIEPDRPQLLPADIYYAVGHGGQFVIVIPSRELEVVRLWLALDPTVWDYETFIHDLVAALDASGRPSTTLHIAMNHAPAK